MKKLSIYSLIVAAILFTTGCSEKTAEVNVNDDGLVNTQQESSETLLNAIPDAIIDEATDGSFKEGEKASEGHYYIINGKKVLIENIYFGFDKYDLSESAKAKVEANSDKLSPLKANTTVKLEGNTDEWGTDEYNYALGLKRAVTVKDALVSNGLKTNISVVSYGESNPVCTDKTKKCWQANRRVEHLLVK